MSTITVTVQQSAKRWPLKRPQRWYWTAQAANGRSIAHSETYTNKQDAINSAILLFHRDTEVVLRAPGAGSVTIRPAS